MQPTDNKNNTNPPLGHFEQTVQRLRDTSNILVTVSSSPTLDQLSACLGLTIALNKAGKHATAVFSGKVPSALEFLKPEKTLETNTNSLRDFIISLDKAKADKLRYKVEDDVVKIFITPYKTSISDKDLEFGQGDFNIETVVAIGVHDKAHLDTAITSHGRILHDATVIGIGLQQKTEFASIDWSEPRASSLSEMVTDIVLEVKKDLLDGQISTALLTGIVVQTDRFRNEKVSPHTMSIAGLLMSAGASTQLVASKLEESSKKAEIAKHKAEISKNDGDDKATPDGTIRIKHVDDKPKEAEKPEPPQELEVAEIPEAKDPEDNDNIKINDDGAFQSLSDHNYLGYDQGPKNSQPSPSQPSDPSKHTSRRNGVILEPPKMGGQLTANSQSEDSHLDGSIDPLAGNRGQQPTILGQKHSSTKQSSKSPTLDQVEEIMTNKQNTLSDIEKTVNSHHLDAVRETVNTTVEAGSPPIPKPHEASGSTTLGDELHTKEQAKSSAPTKSAGPPPPVPPPMMPPTS